MSLFFYGTLRHLPLLELVLGKPRSALNLSKAVLPGHAVLGVAEGPFPMIVTAESAQAEGIVLSDLDAEDLARLDFYEGGFDYDLKEVALANGASAQVYFPQDGLWTAQGRWSLRAWEEEHAEMTLIAAEEVMSYRGKRSRAEVAKMFPVIRARAASILRARRSHHGTQAFRGRVEVVSRKRSYSDFYALDDFKLRHERFDGAMSDVLDRAVLVGADASIVLPYDPVRDEVLLVEQIRLGPVGRGDRTLWQLEPVAGRIDPGETPEEAARREAVEEAGLTIGALERIAEVYPSPGTSTEFYYIFLGVADLSSAGGDTGGLASEDEDIRTHILSFEALMDQVARHDVANAPLALAAYYLSHHRHRLRSDRVAVTPE